MRHGKNKLVFLILSLFLMMLSSCASTKGYYGQSEANVVVISSQRHNVTIGKKNSWEIADLCKVDDKVVKIKIIDTCFYV